MGDAPTTGRSPTACGVGGTGQLEHQQAVVAKARWLLTLLYAAPA